MFLDELYVNPNAIVDDAIIKLIPCEIDDSIKIQDLIKNCLFDKYQMKNREARTKESKRQMDR